VIFGVQAFALLLMNQSGFARYFDMTNSFVSLKESAWVSVRFKTITFYHLIIAITRVSFRFETGNIISSWYNRASVGFGDSNPLSYCLYVGYCSEVFDPPPLSPSPPPPPHKPWFP
jgi:hypothetical protein